jgi:hypothetical protein
MLLPAISAIYPGSEAFVSTPAVVTESTGQTRATFTLLSLAPGNVHMVFIALRPDGLAAPLYEAPAQRQWVAQHRAYWEHFTVTAEEHTKFVQYGFAVPLRLWQSASDPGGASASQGAPRSAVRHNRAEHVALLCRAEGNTCYPPNKNFPSATVS